jgi:hypothetical protein
MILSSSYIGRPKTQVPLWRRDLSLTTWHEIAGTAPNIGVPSLGDFTFTAGGYSGVANDRVNGVTLQAGSGGHEVSDDNAAYKCDLMVALPRWATLFAGDGSRTPTPHQVYWPAPSSRPTGSHLYWDEVVTPINGRPAIVRTLNHAYSYESGGPQRADVFYLDTNDWEKDPGFLIPFLADGGPSLSVAEATVALDSRNGDIWVATSRLMILHTNTTPPTWQNVYNGSVGGFQAGVIDPTLNELLQVKNTTHIQGISCASSVITDRPYTWSGSPYGGGHVIKTMIIQERNNCIYTIHDDNTTMSRLDLSTFVRTLVGSVPTASFGGQWNRMEDYPLLGGLVYWPSGTKNMWFYPTEAM